MPGWRGSEAGDTWIEGAHGDPRPDQRRCPPDDGCRGAGPDQARLVRAPRRDAVCAAARARRMLEAGITTARDLGAADADCIAVRELIASGESLARACYARAG